MILEHSDFQGLFEKVAEILEKHKDNPQALEAILKELDREYKKIPIYPGIIGTTLPEVVNQVEAEDLENGAEVTISLKDGSKITGKLEKTDSDELVLSDCKKIGPVEDLEKSSIPKEEISKISELRSDLIAENWPSLDFEVEE